MSFIELAKDRFSCRNLSSQPVEKEKIEQILEACTLAPTAINTQPFKVWVFESEEAMNKLRAITEYHFGAPMAMIIGNLNSANGYTRDFDGHNFNEVDTTIAATHLMLEVHDLGLRTTWVGHFDVNRMKEAFPDMAGYDLLALFPIGYPADSVKAPGSKRRKRISEFAEFI